ncbi:alpha/beta fold hydrolase [Chloroflexia bacterium SDU3-3]|nr:alpha/beta fold hydrolase [Chloroflexia bacterium SDU3-3]
MWLRFVRTTLIGISLLTVIVFSAIAAHAYLRYRSITPPATNSDCCSLPSAELPGVAAVQIAAPDQTALACWYTPSHNRAAVIVLHGEGGDRSAMLPHMAILARHGYGVLACDRRAHGASDGALRSWGWLEVGDVGAMVDYLAQRGDVDQGRVGIFGFSMGAQVALRASAAYPALRAVVADGAVPATSADLTPAASAAAWPRSAVDWLDNWFVDRMLERATAMAAPAPMAQALGQRSQPLLLIATGQDGHGRELRQNQWFHTLAAPPKALWELPDVGHGEGLARRAAEYERRVIALYDAALLGETP